LVRVKTGRAGPSRRRPRDDGARASPSYRPRAFARTPAGALVLGIPARRDVGPRRRTPRGRNPKAPSPRPPPPRRTVAGASPKGVPPRPPLPAARTPPSRRASGLSGGEGPGRDPRRRSTVAYGFLLTISSAFDPLFRVLFTFPSQYFFAIGLVAIFSFGWDRPPDWGCNLEQPDSRKKGRPATRRRGPTGLSPSKADRSRSLVHDGDRADPHPKTTIRRPPGSGTARF